MGHQIKSILSPFRSEPDVLALLDVCVGRLLRREGEVFEIGEEQLRHIADWLRAALANDDPWLKNVDEHGRPKKLMKFGSINAIVREADKAMLKAAQRLKGIKLVDGDEALYAEISDGFYLVRLLTPAALDRESAEMQHCIGNGAYDRHLADGTHLYLSLRDPQGHAHATLDIWYGVLIQLQGKQNAPPIRKYLNVLVPYIRASGLGVNVPASHLGHVIDVDGVWHPIESLSEGLKVGGSLDLRGTKITALPKGLSVVGNLVLTDTPITKLPEGLLVGGNLVLDRTPISTLPKRLKVGGFLNLNRTPITVLPDDLSVGTGIYLSHSKIRVLPDGLSVGGDLYLQHTPISALPEKLRVRGRLQLDRTLITTLPKGLKVRGHLSLVDVKISKLPDGLSVGGSLNLNNTLITVLPKGLNVGQDLSMYDTKIAALPNDLKVGGCLTLSDPLIAMLFDIFDDNPELNCVSRTMTIQGFRDIIGTRVVDMKHGNGS